MELKRDKMRKYAPLEEQSMQYLPKRSGRPFIFDNLYYGITDDVDRSEEVTEAF